MDKHRIEKGETKYYRRYVDYTMIIFNQHKITEDSITSYMNNIHKHLESKIKKKKIKQLIIYIYSYRVNNKLQLGIYRKPTQTIHFTPKLLLENKLAAYSFYINRMLPTPIKEHNHDSKNGGLSVYYVGLMVYHYR
jgi:hypothetical protein